eukprot:56468_1
MSALQLIDNIIYQFETNVDEHVMLNYWKILIGTKTHNNLTEESLKTAQQCKDIQNCDCFQRLLFGFKLYNQLKRNNNESLFEKRISWLKSYDPDQFIADNEHVIACHGNILEEEYLLCELFKNKVASCCSENCLLYSRNNRRRIRDKIAVQINLSAFEELLDAYHSYYFHSDLIELEYNIVNNNFNQDYVKEAADTPMNVAKFNTDCHTTAPKYQFGIKMHHYNRIELCADSQYIEPRYPSLKEELLNCPFLTGSNEFSINDWNKEYKKFSKLKKSSIRAKKLKKRAQFIKKCISTHSAEPSINQEEIGIEKDTQISVQHLIAAVTYTDYDELQRIFKEQCRLTNDDDSPKNVYERNAHIGNWCKLLNELVHFFGHSASSDKKLYHGISKKIIFSNCIFSVWMPLSTTTKSSVALKFGGIAGIVLRIIPKQNTGFGSCFDMKWISRHKQESELFFYNATLLIEQIRYPFVGWRSNDILALRMLQNIFKPMGDYSASDVIQYECATVTDGLYKYMKKQHISNDDINSLQIILDDEQYDSEAIIYDVADNLSNIANIIHDKGHYGFINKYIQHIIGMENIETQLVKMIEHLVNPPKDDRKTEEFTNYFEANLVAIMQKKITNDKSRFHVSEVMKFQNKLLREYFIKIDDNNQYSFGSLITHFDATYNKKITLQCIHQQQWKISDLEIESMLKTDNVLDGPMFSVYSLYIGEYQNGEYRNVECKLQLKMNLLSDVHKVELMLYLIDLDLVNRPGTLEWMIGRKIQTRVNGVNGFVSWSDHKQAGCMWSRSFYVSEVKNMYFEIDIAGTFVESISVIKEYERKKMLFMMMQRSGMLT